MLTHEKLDVYQLSIQFVAYTLEVIQGITKGNADLTRQLRRSAFSIPANIAEGAGKTSTADKKRFYSIARGSATESASHYDVMFITGLISKSELEVAKQNLTRIVAMLSKLAR